MESLWKPVTVYSDYTPVIAQKIPEGKYPIFKELKMRSYVKQAGLDQFLHQTWKTMQG